MARPPHRAARRRLRSAVAGAVVLTAIMAATAGASVPPGETQAPQTTRLVTRPRTPIPGFLLDRGRYTRFDAPQAVVQTEPGSINNRGEIVGHYMDAAGIRHGFLRDRRGRFATIDVPGARTGTVALRINDHGQIVGRYDLRAVDDPAPRFRGFLLDHGKLVRIDVPDAVATQPAGINNRAQVVGEYRDAAGGVHGFRWERGRFTTVDLPGAVATSLVDIDDRGQLLGAYVDGRGSLRNFLLDRGRVTTFAAPGELLTFARDLNNRGQVAGFTLTGLEEFAQGARGFLLADGVRGRFTPIDVPGAPRNQVMGLNDRTQLVGFYENTNATPSA